MFRFLMTFVTNWMSIKYVHFVTGYFCEIWHNKFKIPTILKCVKICFKNCLPKAIFPS